MIFHNLKGYDSHLIFKVLSKFNVKISVIPRGLEKYMAFTINWNIVFIDSMQLMNSSLDSLVKSLGDRDFKYLSEECSGELLELAKEKGVYPYEYMDSLKDLMNIIYLISMSFLVLQKTNALVKKNMTELLIFGMYLK